MRNTLLVVALAAIPLVAGCKHAHIATGISRLPYQGHSLHPAVEFRAGYTPEWFPRWTAAFALSHTRPPFDSAPYIEPNCVGANAELLDGKGTGCRPTIVHDWSALEVYHRWNPTNRVHPLASVALGRLSTGYFVWPRSDSTEASIFLAVGGGAELSITRWLHISVAAGYRQPFSKTIPNRSVSNSGPSITSLLLIGTPYRDR